MKKVINRGICAALCALLALLFVCAFIPAGNTAEAAGNAWSVRVTKLTTQGGGTVYTDLSPGDRMTENYTLAFLISYPNPDLYTGNDYFHYLETETEVSNPGAVLGWKQIDAGDLNEVVLGGITYKEYRYEPLGGANKCDKYVYFRRSYSDSDGITQTSVYEHSWNIVINILLDETKLGINAITAEYQNEAGNTVPYTGRWIQTSVRFTVATEWMNFNGTTVYDPSDELLFYSTDGKNTADESKSWIAMNSNSLTLSANMKNYVDFKVTDISQTHKSYRRFTSQVNIDKEVPKFILTAVTTDTSGNQVSYGTTQWTSNSVYFTITRDNNCLSGITYYYRSPATGNNWELYTSASYVCATSVENLQFRAQNEAGVTFDSDPYKVQIDNIRPNASLNVLTDDPESSLTDPPRVALGAADGVYYSNGKIYFHIYNRAVDGTVIQNSSPLHFYYAKGEMDADGNWYYSNYTELSASQKDGNGYNYYSFSDEITTGTSISRRYRFYIRSDAGLISGVSEFAAVLLSKAFSVKVMDRTISSGREIFTEVNEIKYSANAKGWASEPIRVYVQMPTDARATEWYSDGSVRTWACSTEYLFYYAPTEVANLLYSAKGVLYNHVSEGQSIFYFDLSASANSTFAVYAKNMAGKSSINTFRSENKIMIDTTDPTVWIEAFVKDSATGAATDIEIQSGNWVNGSIILTLKATIGISSIYAYQLQYVKDALGRPVRDSNGKIVWLDNSAVMPQSESVEGVAYYHIEISLPDTTTVRMTEYLGYRIYTGSGVYTDIEFVANLVGDVNLVLEEVQAVGFADGSADGDRTAVVGNEIRLDPVSKDFFIKLFVNAEYKDIFGYMLFTGTGYETIDEEKIEVLIPIGLAGEKIIIFKLISKAVNDKGGYTVSKTEFTIIVNYNTKNISISYSAHASVEVGDGTWKSGSLEVSVSLQSSDEGGPIKELTLEEKASYTYYYMLINYYGFVSENDAIRKGTWIKVDTSNNGGYDGLSRYNFSIYFNNSSFYGYLALSVCNEADYRSSSSGFVANRIAIDNTTPNVSDTVIQTKGESTYDSDTKTYTYYSMEKIVLANNQFQGRSNITYYYYVIPFSGTVPSANPSSGNANGWTVLTANVAFNPGEGNNTVYNVMLYGINELGARNGGLTDGNYTVYRFIIDTSKVTGELSYSPWDGGYYNSSTGLWSYSWKDNATINLSSAGSNTSVSFWYSINESSVWTRYGTGYYAAGTSVSIIFDKNIFPDGVMGTFKFKAVNRAGYEHIYGEKIYIEMDDKAPQFEVVLTVNGSPYYGGGTEFTDTTGQWSDTDITIKINLTFANVSGVKFTYRIIYYPENTETYAHAEMPVPNSISFSSYTILSDKSKFPNRSGDIVLEIIGTNKARAERFTVQKVRMRIDKTIPTFELRGEARSSESSTTVTVVSGQWTNHKQVVLSRDNAAKNTSKVTYLVTYEDLTSTGKEQYLWTTGNSLQPCTQTSTVTVKATSEAGRSYTVVFQVNIDTIAPIITFMGGINVVRGEKHYIDLKVVVLEENIKICQYVVIIDGGDKGFPLDPSGYIISTSSVDNSTNYDTTSGTPQPYRGYVRIIVEDYAGNTATFEFYMLPFALTVNNITLSDDDARTLEKYQEDLAKARIYMDSKRVIYFENLIQRLKDRINTINQEIAGYRAYMEKLAQRISYELKSDYEEVFSYLETYNNYALYGQEWIQKAIQGDASGKYYAYYKNLRSVFDELKAQMDMVKAVEESTKKLPATNVVEAADYNDVLRVYDAYNDLGADQKACFLTTLYTKLLTLKKKCEVLLLTDAATGISIDGDFTPGAKVKITKYSSNTEPYNNAQSAILSAIPASAPRAVISMDRISLTGAVSQTATGTVRVVLPIPEEWQQYITFAVYKVSSDGTVSSVSDMITSGDGKTVEFTSNELSTFVLCAKANVQQTVKNDDVYGTIMGLELDVVMIRNFAIIGAVVFVIVMIVVIMTGVRRKRFLNSYNKAYTSKRYRKSIQQIPYGNTYPRTNPLKGDERVTNHTRPY